MKIIRQCVDGLLFSSLFAACCTVGLCMATERLLLDVFPLICTALHTMAFGSTLLVYNVHYLIKKSSHKVSDRFDWSARNRVWHFIFGGVGLVLCGGSVFVLPYTILLACVALGILSFLYSLPLLPFSNKKPFRDFGWIKILLLATVWTMVTAVLPILFYGNQVSNYPFEIAIRFVFLFTLSIAFDIRDIQTDLDAHIYTLPNLIGEKNSYRLMSYTLLLFILLGSFQWMRYHHTDRLIGMVLTAIALKAAINYTQKYPTDRAYLALVDGTMLLYALLVLLL